MTGEPHAADDRELLRAYVGDGSESAFSELVRRHLPSVYSAAFRRVNGERALAEDVTQQVFADLARKARALPPEVVLGGWLHRHTGFVALKALDRERRRRTREKEAATMNAMHLTDPLWHQLSPLLDEALDRLPEGDRDALVLRFFEKQDYRTVGAALGVSDDTAQKRVARALEKLRAWLSRHGVTSTAGALSAVLTAEAVRAAPASLESSLAGSALATAASGGGGLTWWEWMSRATRWKLAAAGGVVAGTLAWQQVELQRLRGAAEAARPSAGVTGGPSLPAPPTPVMSRPPAGGAVDALHGDVIAEAARILRGGLQDISATTQALSVLSKIEDGQIPRALASVAGVKDEAAQALIYKYLIGRWAETQPWEALGYVQETLPMQCRPGVFEGVLTAWAGHDPESALAWFQKSRGSAPPPLRESLLATIFRGLGTRDLAGAVAQLGWVRTENERGQALRGLLDAVRTDDDRQSLLQSAETLEDEAARHQLRRAVVEQWVQADPESAAAYVAEAEPAHERTGLMDSLGLAWLQTEPEKAADWWVQSAPGSQTLIKIMNVWAHNDPNGAGEWLGQQPAGPDSDPARMTFARQIADLDPESALQWAETISDPPMREDTIGHVFGEWRVRDAAAAQLFLQKTTWPEERVARLVPPVSPTSN